MNEFSMGFVAVFEEPLREKSIREILAVWIECCERVEQVIPNQVATTKIAAAEDVMIGQHMQFRLVSGDQFAWAYITLERLSIETTGMPNGDQPSLSLTVLTELPDVVRVIPDTDEKLLDLMEEKGLL